MLGQARRPADIKILFEAFPFQGTGKDRSKPISSHSEGMGFFVSCRAAFNNQEI
jgi:hypothetical protein